MNRALITGGGGFVGKAIVKRLLADKVHCTVIGRRKYPELEAAGVSCIQGDIADPEVMEKNMQGFDVVFHVAALAGIWGKWQAYFKTNVIGTQNVIRCCQKNNITKMVYTSTPSVVFDKSDIVNGDENLPYPASYLCHYAKSKMLAEKMVLELSQSEIATCALRPHLIWGPDDPHIIPRLIQQGRAGDLKIVGDGSNMVDISYIDNVAHAHILAAKNLLGPQTVAGKAYFIGQERPVVLWQWINELFAKLDIAVVEKKVPLAVAYPLGGMLEIMHIIFCSGKEPKMTRFLAQQLAKSHCFSHDRAKKDFGYSPRITIEEGMDRLLHWLKAL